MFTQHMTVFLPWTQGGLCQQTTPEPQHQPDPGDPPAPHSGLTPPQPRQEARWPQLPHLDSTST